jgi:xanthine/CO dehydrogenase XdhC/CoxF family maturation factor
VAVRAEFRRARPALFVFGAGNDAIPLVRQAKGLGWYVVLADGRSHLATRERFPEADEVHVVSAAREFPLRPLAKDAAAIMTHSLEQDTYFLKNLLDQDLGYLGVLGPLRRTQDVLQTIAKENEDSLTEQIARREDLERRIHAPMGLDLGGDTPADVALSVIAEIQRTLRHGSGVAMGTLRKRAMEQDASTLSVPAD